MCGLVRREATSKDESAYCGLAGRRNNKRCCRLRLSSAPTAGVLRCTRQVSLVTWQKQIKHAAHFALHDLTHYAVATALGYCREFFGLIAEGGEIKDTTGKGA